MSLSVFAPTTALALLLAFGLGGCGDHPKNATPAAVAPTMNSRDEVRIPADSPRLKQIQVGTIETAAVPSDEVTSPGKIEANPNRLSHVVLPVAGRVISVLAHIGDLVHQGQPLLTLESPDVDSAISSLQQAEAAVTQARSVLAKSQADMDRAKDLFEHNAIAQKEVINAQAMWTQATAAVEQAIAATQQSRRRLEIYGVQPGQYGQRLTIRSPISGKVLEMSIVQGEYRNDISDSVISIADLSTVWVTADVPETSIRKIQTGEKVTVELAAYPGDVFTARVRQIADTVDPQTRTVKVRAELDNRAGRLRPEMFGQIRHTDATEMRPVVPAGAVVQEDSRTIVWRELEQGLFRRTPVQTGSRQGDRVAILQGITAGDRIVTDGVMLLKGN